MQLGCHCYRIQANIHAESKYFVQRRWRTDKQNTGKFERNKTGFRTKLGMTIDHLVLITTYFGKLQSLSKKRENVHADLAFRWSDLTAGSEDHLGSFPITAWHSCSRMLRTILQWGVHIVCRSHLEVKRKDEVSSTSNVIAMSHDHSRSIYAWVYPLGLLNSLRWWKQHNLRRWNW